MRDFGVFGSLRYHIMMNEVVLTMHIITIIFPMEMRMFFVETSVLHLKMLRTRLLYNIMNKDVIIDCGKLYS